MTVSKFLLGLGAMALMSVAASASTLVVTCTVVSSPTELNANAVCPQFNGSGLASVDILVTGTISGTITLTNNSATTQTVAASTQSQFSVGSLAGFTFVNPIFQATFSTGSQTLNPGQSATFAGLNTTASADLGAQSASLAPYSGAGTFNLGLSTLTGLTLLGGGGQVGSVQSTSASATAQVTYTYNTTSTTPEPATVSMLGIGLVGLGFAFRRFRQQ